jgi:hypothetical protein
MMRRRSVNAFSLSFLDCMFCGFGAVILLVMIVNTDMVQRRDEVRRDLVAESEQLKSELSAETRRLARLRKQLEEALARRLAAALQAAEANAAIGGESRRLAAAEDQSDSGSERVRALQKELRKLDAQRRELAAQITEQSEQAEQGRRLREVVGEGDRQYLTGLKVGGERVVILLDASASMLDETIVNVIRMRNLSPERRRSSAKWQRALAAVDWLVSQIPQRSLFQIYLFDEFVRAAVEGSEGTWLETKDIESVNRSLDRLREAAPASGTSLYHAFASLRELSPRPDNVFLVTDGLPTRGKLRPLGSTVSPERRRGFFDEAVGALPARVPINTILLPMEGDPEAASAFWKLAVSTRGAFITPSKDWP